MGSIFDYVKKYGDLSYTEKEFTDIDASIFSLLSYIDFDGLLNKNERVFLHEAIDFYFQNKNIKEFSKRGFAQKELIKLCRLLKEKIRYKNTLVVNYMYKISLEEQFGAVTFILENKKKVISFEGTDCNLVGWEEDLALSYKFPVLSQKDAIKYLRKNIKLRDKDVFVVGHSKGGHLALVSSMYARFYKKGKIKKIYNFDGPGLRDKQIESSKYKRIEYKLRYIIPQYSIVGLLLRHNDNYMVVKTNRKDLYAHFIFTWEVKDDFFLFGKLSKVSHNLDDSIIIWLNQHGDKRREKFSKDLFEFIRKAGIRNFNELFKIKNVLILFMKRKDLDEETKNLLTNFIKFNFDYHLHNRK